MRERITRNGVSPGDDGIFSALRRRLHFLPVTMLLAVLALGGIGVAMLYSAAPEDWSPWAGAHVVRLAAGVVIMLAVALIPVRHYRRLAVLGWFGVIGLLVAVEFSGTGSGAQRWLSLGGVTLQPSEFAKLAVVVLLAAWFAGLNAESVRKIRNYIPVAIVVLVPVLLVLAQPDLGTAIMILASATAMVFIAGVPRWMIVSFSVLMIVAIPITWTQLYEYQKDRIRTFLSPESDALGAGYQIIQSKIALGSGGLFGKGYLEGSQSRLNYLPEKQTDFVFTMIGEEFGFTGCLVVLALYGYVIFAIARAGLGLSATFSRLLVIGIAAMLFFYIFVNIGMVTGMLPVVGAPLPLISYGGTAVLTVFIALGLVLSAIIHDRPTSG